MNKGFSTVLVGIIVALVFAVIGGGALFFTNVQDEIPKPSTRSVQQEQQPETTSDLVDTAEKNPIIESSDFQKNETEKTSNNNQFTQPPKEFRLEIPTKRERENLPSCEALQFTSYPVDMSKVPDIAPLGNLGPPGHTFPTDHTYISVGEDVGGQYGSGKAYDLFSPANVYLTSVSWGDGDTQDPRDYVIYFALCKDVIGYYNHVKTVSPQIQAILDNYECEDFGQQAPNSCTKVLDLDSFEEGKIMGTVGLKQGNFDFGLIDLRVDLDFIKPERHAERTLHIQCAYDYYPEDMKKTFYDLIPRTDGTCGRTMQDVPGTLMGAWFHENAKEKYVVDWQVYLAFVEDNYYPDVQVVSVAGIFTNPGKYESYPENSGNINRKFTDVTADGNVYCYESGNVEKHRNSIPSGKIVVQMVDEETLQIEYQEGSCNGDEKFGDYEIYRR